ncbi:hypothetical protein Pcinc_030761 [Petrolisthes cinctipes]|uniref:Uncharacterized protein n=1 Tax=Petrolisthes cinctipes TaxID=88211 RepID=A0AAE1EXP8_PETCI|nr:hypothetical protein Pcinc_030761 [Petrolisthes cinctipes]
MGVEEAAGVNQCFQDLSDVSTPHIRISASLDPADPDHLASSDWLLPAAAVHPSAMWLVGSSLPTPLTCSPRDGWHL